MFACLSNYALCLECNEVNPIPRHVHYTTSGQVFFWFLLGTGRMLHPVGGAIGVALCTAVKRGHTCFDIMSLIFIMPLHAGICLAVVNYGLLWYMYT